MHRSQAIEGTRRSAGTPRVGHRVPQRLITMGTLGLRRMSSEAKLCIREMTSIPSTTSPKTTFLPSHHGAGVVVMKNCRKRAISHRAGRRGTRKKKEQK
jgi:fructoselysine-6-P-deglycase FrlB-like protein